MALTPSWLEKTCRYVPVLGWIVASELEQRRNLPLLTDIGKQLQLRSKTDPEIWGDSVRREFALFVASCIKDELNWPNDNFVPDDCFGVLFLNDDGAGATVLAAIESYLGLSKGTITKEEFRKLDQMTFGEVIDRLLSLKSR